MKTRITTIFVLFSIFGYGQSDFTQQVVYGPMCINPGFTGVKNIISPDTSHTRLVDILTDANIGNDDYNIMATYQMPLDKIHSGIGVMVNYNGYTYSGGWDGLLSTYHVYAAKLYYRYSVMPRLSLGVSAGIVGINGDFGLYKTKNPFDADIGMAYHDKVVFAGLSIGHITRPSYWINPITYRDIPYYEGVAINALLGFNIALNKTRIVLSGSVYNYNPAFHLLVYPVKWFYAGFAWTNYYDGTKENPYRAIPQISDIRHNSYNVISFMGGFSMFKNKLTLSLALNFYYGLVHNWNFRSYGPYNYDTEFDTGIGF